MPDGWKATPAAAIEEKRTDGLAARQLGGWSERSGDPAEGGRRLKDNGERENSWTAGRRKDAVR